VSTTDDAKTVREWFESLPARVPPDRAAGLTDSYLFDIGGAGMWYVAAPDGKLVVEEGERDADARISVSADTFRKLVAREQSAMRAFMTGKIKVSGDMGAATKLQQLLG
jgi:putative sterol carrier protein